MTGTAKIFLSGRMVMLAVLALLAGAALSLLANHGRMIPAGGAERDLAALVYSPEANYVSWTYDHLRELVNAHSSRASDTADERVDATDGDLAAIAAHLYAFAVGDDARPPALTPRQRAAILRKLLEDRGYRARIVTLFAGAGDFSRHYLVEVYNRRTQSWEVQDPDYNVFFTFNGSTQRVEVRDMIAQPPNNFTPCVMEGYCGWNSVSAEQLSLLSLKPYFGAALIMDDGAPTLLVNDERIDSEALCMKWPETCVAATSLP